LDVRRTAITAEAMDNGPAMSKMAIVLIVDSVRDRSCLDASRLWLHGASRNR
jgi:hypothetical protein